MRLSRSLAVAAIALCLAAATLATAQDAEPEFRSEYKKFKDVPGLKKDAESGARYLELEDGVWTAVKDPDSKNIYFVNEAAQKVQWHDPRAPAPKMKTMDIKLPPITPPKPKANPITVAMVAMLPIVLLAGGTAARIIYLQMYYPELLWPTKERKDRRKAAGGKIRTPKARGRLNQDGRGGRSNNL